MDWWRRLKGKVKIKEPLKRHTTLKIGGPAEFFILPRDREDLKLLITLAKRYKIPLSVIGAGSNILAGDRGLRRIVVKLGAGFFKKIKFKNNIVEAGSGLMLAEIIRRAQARGLSGAEFLSGIPGTLGGALAMNAGAGGKGIADLLISAEVMDCNGRLRSLSARETSFDYRKSGLSKYTILSARLKFVKKSRRQIRENLKKYRQERSSSQDNSFPSAGSVFRNPPGDYAGRLIELCGLKGRRCGGAQISRRHANFILNCRNARANDVLKLIGLAKRRVRDKFNIELRPEVKIWQ